MPSGRRPQVWAVPTPTWGGSGTWAACPHWDWLAVRVPGECETLGRLASAQLKGARIARMRRPLQRSIRVRMTDLLVLEDERARTLPSDGVIPKNGLLGSTAAECVAKQSAARSIQKMKGCSGGAPMETAMIDTAAMRQRAGKENSLPYNSLLLS